MYEIQILFSNSLFSPCYKQKTNSGRLDLSTVIGRLKLMVFERRATLKQMQLQKFCLGQTSKLNLSSSQAKCKKNR